MKFSTKKILSYLFCISYGISFGQYITVDANKTAQQLIENILINSSCANASDYLVKGDTFTTGQNSYGYFNSGTSNFPFKEGIVLSTWSSTKAQGPLIPNDDGGGSQKWLGDTDLEQALGLSNTLNATAIEFDFIPLTNTVSFNYLFASNEYQHNYPCKYSDGFAFLIKEKASSANYQNLAVLPGTTTPVSSKNVHPLINPYKDNQGITQPGCLPVHENYYNGANTSTSPINYTGQTKVFTALTNVVAGKVYHIKLVIADDLEADYDSAVFLQAGSFSSKIDLGPDRSITTNNAICFGSNILIDSKLSANYAYTWYKDGVKIEGANSPSYNVTSAGTYKIVVNLSSTCFQEDEIKIEFAPKTVIKDITLAQCDDDGDAITLFDLTKVNDIIKNNYPSLVQFDYYETLSDAQNQIKLITNPTSYKNSTPNQTLAIRTINTSGCESFAKLTLTVANNSIATQNPIETCDDDAIQDGLFHFDLNTQITPQVINGLTAGLLVEYYISEKDAIVQKNKLPTIFNNTIPNQQIIYARIINGADCFRITPITLIVKTLNITDFQNETVYQCDVNQVELRVESGFNSYIWSTGAVSNTITVTTPGNYDVTVTGSNGCTRSKTFLVINSQTAVITAVRIKDFSGNDNSVLVQYTGNGDYEFSLNNIDFQDNPLFTNVAPNKYSLIVRNKNGCPDSVPYTIYIMDYPRFFTPNGDGINDLWQIKNIEIIPKALITIYDRYGKLLKQLNESSTGWNGTYINSKLPADDYWFTITFDTKKIIEGHFTLKR
jgi:gliding motility-associated-like protein